MKVCMKVSISGTRNGVDWPPAGSELEVSDAEGASLVAGGLAEAVAATAKPEKRPAKRAEKRA